MTDEAIILVGLPVLQDLHQFSLVFIASVSHQHRTLSVQVKDRHLQDQTDGILFHRLLLRHKVRRIIQDFLNNGIPISQDLQGLQVLPAQVVHRVRVVVVVTVQGQLTNVGSLLQLGLQGPVEDPASDNSSGPSAAGPESHL